MPLNTDLAKENTSALEDSCRHRSAEAELRRKDWQFRRFFDYVQNNKTLGVNLAPTTLLILLTPKVSATGHVFYEKYKNLHTLVTSQALPDDQHYRRRCEMEDMLGFGSEKKDLYYVALNTGNEGIQRWGSYCLILRSSANITDRVSFLANNSYSYLFSYSGEARRPFQIDRAIWTNVQELVAVKHFTALMETEESLSSREMDNLVLNANRADFIEGHLYYPGGFDITEMAEVRVSHQLMTRFLYLESKARIVGISNRNKFYEYWIHKEIVTLLEVGQIPLTVV